MQKVKRNKILTILLFIQIGLVYLLSKFPDHIENIYSNGIYVLISSIFRTIFGWFPFSVGDLLYTFLVILIIRFLILVIKRRFGNMKSILFQVGANLSVFYFCFYFFWGLNYSRPPIISSLNLEITETTLTEQRYNIEKLENLADKILYKIIRLQNELVSHDSIAVQVPYSKSEILNYTSIGYENLSNTFKQFKYKPSSIKKSIYSLPLTYMGFAGYFNPLTGEAQVDYLIPKISLPMTCSHEVAHQLGIASESEANFVGFLAASFHNDKYFQYSAYLGAFRYILYDIYMYDSENYENYVSKIPLGVKKNIRQSQDFWNSYKNPFEPFFKIFYDNYLKANQQKMGISSYNQVVELLLAYDAKYQL